MEYSVEEVSPVKRTIHVTVPEDEVEAAIGAAVALYGRDMKVDGFRKGKVPSKIIEGRYKKQIYSEATTDLVNLHINEIVGEMGVSPVSRIDYDGGELVRGEPFKYTISFEVMPEFELPPYVGVEVDEETPAVNPEEVQAVIDRMREQLAELQPIDEDRPPQDGEVAVITFKAYTLDDEPIPGVQAENFELPVGEGQALGAFEDIVKKLKTTEQGEGEVTFPEDFLNEELAGKTVKMKVMLHAIKKKVLPEADADFARQSGGFESLDQMKEAVEHSYIQSRKQLARSNAQKELLDKLMKMVEFETPPSMVERHLNAMIEDLSQRLEQQGRSLGALGKSREELENEHRAQAEELARSEAFLLTLAKKEGVEVSDQEIDFYFRQMAARSGEDFNQLKNFYIQNNLIWAVRDKLLGDKAMDLLYSKAVVNEVPPKSADAAESAGSGESGEEA